MKKALLFLTVISSLTFLSCSSSNDDEGNNDSLIGTWNLSHTDDGFSYSTTLTFGTTTITIVDKEVSPENETTIETTEGTYTANDNSITITLPGDGDDDETIVEATYSIDNNVLTVTFNDNGNSETEEYTRQ